MEKQVFISMADGEIVNKTTMRNAFADLPNGRYLVKIERKNKRSLPQNAYYWACVVPMVKEGLRNIGYDEVKTEEDAHEIMKYLFLKRQIGSKETGEMIEFTRSTTKLTTTLFSEYLESIYKWGAEFLGINIPAPSQPIEMFT
jgi:hypothetical protein